MAHKTFVTQEQVEEIHRLMNFLNTAEGYGLVTARVDLDDTTGEGSLGQIFWDEDYDSYVWSRGLQA